MEAVDQNADQIMQSAGFGAGAPIIRDLHECWGLSSFDVATVIAHVICEDPGMSHCEFQTAVEQQLAKLGAHRGFCRASDEFEEELRRTKRAKYRDRIRDNIAAVHRSSIETLTNFHRANQLLEAAGFCHPLQSIPPDFVERLRRAVPLLKVEAAVVPASAIHGKEQP